MSVETAWCAENSTLATDRPARLSVGYSECMVCGWWRSCCNRVTVPGMFSTEFCYTKKFPCLNTNNQNYTTATCRLGPWRFVRCWQNNWSPVFHSANAISIQLPNSSGRLRDDWKTVWLPFNAIHTHLKLNIASFAADTNTRYMFHSVKFKSIQTSHVSQMRWPSWLLPHRSVPVSEAKTKTTPPLNPHPPFCHRTPPICSHIFFCLPL